MARLKITVERIDGYCNLPVLVGDHFFVDDYKLEVPEGKFVCIWALQSLIPLLPLQNEQERLAEDHWARGVNRVHCPDPKGKVFYRVERVDDDPG
jgi:uncharacterized repeat protein (TIGR04076 family)